MYRFSKDTDDESIRQKVWNYLNGRFIERKAPINARIYTSEFIRELFNSPGFGIDMYNAGLLGSGEKNGFVSYTEGRDVNKGLMLASNYSVYLKNYHPTYDVIERVNNLTDLIDEYKSLSSGTKITYGFLILAMGNLIRKPVTYTIEDMIQFNDWVSDRIILKKIKAPEDFEKFEGESLFEN